MSPRLQSSTGVVDEGADAIHLARRWPAGPRVLVAIALAIAAIAGLGSRLDHPAAMLAPLGFCAMPLAFAWYAMDHGRRRVGPRTPRRVTSSRGWVLGLVLLGCSTPRPPSTQTAPRATMASSDAGDSARSDATPERAETVAEAPETRADTRLWTTEIDPDMPHDGTARLDDVEQQRQRIAIIADLLRRDPRIERVVIEGHCDRAFGREAQPRSTEVALAVQRAMVDLGVAPERLTAIGLGSRCPRDPRRGTSAVARNNRVHWTVLRVAGRRTTARVGCAAASRQLPPELRPAPP